MDHANIEINISDNPEGAAEILSEISASIELFYRHSDKVPRTVCDEFERIQLAFLKLFVVK